MTKLSKKILFSFFVTIMLMVCVLSASAANEGPFVYEINNGEVTIIKCAPTVTGDLIIPDTLGGMPVVKIGEKAFYYCSEITSIAMGDNIRSIGKEAFAFCGALSKVVLSEELTELAEGAFYMCFNLNEASLSKTKLKSIGESAFANCGYLAVAALPDTLETVGKEAFLWCDNMQSLIIGKNVKNIGEFAFSKCYNVRDVYYMGTQQDFANVKFEVGNNLLETATMYYEHIHVYECETVSVGDCLTRGRKIYSCRCGDIYNDVSYGPHSYENVITKATFKADGKTEKKCKLCGNIKKTTIIPKVTAKFAKTAYAYSGKVITPTVTVTNTEGAVLTADKSYTLKYSSGRKEMGEYAVRVTLSGSKYEGTTKIYFNIIPGRASVTTDEDTDKITLTWEKVKGAKGYRVYSYNVEKKTYKALKTITGTSYTITNLESGTDYAYSVRAYGKVGGETIWGSHSVVKTATVPSTVKISSATSGSAGKVTVKWASTAATGYEIYMATGKDGQYKKIKTITKNTTTSYIKSSLKAGTTYSFIVRAYKTVGDTKLYGDFSKVKYATVK